MIKRVIGLLAAVAVVVIIVFATLNRDKYRSMLEERGAEKSEAPAAEPLRRVQVAQPAQSAPGTQSAQPAQDTQLQQTAEGDSLRLEQK